MSGASGYRILVRDAAAAVLPAIDVGGLAADPDGVVRHTIAGLSMGVDYRIAVTAYAASGSESAPSNELPVNMAPPTATPTSSATQPPAATSTATWTSTPTASATQSATAPPTNTATAPPTSTASATVTSTAPPTATASRTATASATRTNTATPSATRTTTQTTAPTGTASPSPSPTATASPRTAWRVTLPKGLQAQAGTTVAMPVDFGGGGGLRQAALRITFDPRVVALTSPRLRLSAGIGTITTAVPSPGTVDVVATLDAPLSGAGVLFDLDVNAVGACRSVTTVHIASCTLDGGAADCVPVDGSVDVRCGVTGRIRHWASGAAVTGASVHLHGDAATMQTTTDTLGQFTFAADATETGTWELEPQMAGGLGNAVSALDAALVLRAVTAAGSLDQLQALACDVTGNGSLTALDAARILQVSVGLRAHVPVADTCGSDWAFVPDPAESGAAGMAPVMRGGTCTDSGVALDLTGGDPPPQEFLGVPLGDCSGNWAPTRTAAAQRLGSAVAWLGTPRPRPGHEWAIPLHVAGDLDFQAVDARLTVLDGDGTTPRVQGVGAARAATAAVNTAADGRVALAIADATTLTADGRPIAVLIWHGAAAPRVRLDQVALDELAVRVR